MFVANYLWSIIKGPIKDQSPVLVKCEAPRYDIKGRLVVLLAPSVGDGLNDLVKCTHENSMIAGNHINNCAEGMRIFQSQVQAQEVDIDCTDMDLWMRSHGDDILHLSSHVPTSKIYRSLLDTICQNKDPKLTVIVHSRLEHVGLGLLQSADLVLCSSPWRKAQTQDVRRLYLARESEEQDMMQFVQDWKKQVRQFGVFKIKNNLPKERGSIVEEKA
jgi:hypothetical protein